MQIDDKEINKILLRYNLQDDLTARYVIESNFLTKYQINNCKKNIISALQGDKIASKQPLAILVGGQPGAGKTALINYTQNYFNPREFVVIDNDFFRAFHPNVSYIRKNYPQFYTCATEQLGADITDDIVSYFTGQNETNSKYNIIVHQTLSKSYVATGFLEKFNNLGYITGLNVLAVPYIESKMSQIERCEAQYNNLGFCRYVDSKHHFNSVSWLLNTVDKIESENLADFINVFARSENISSPTCIYTQVNNEDLLNDKDFLKLNVVENKNGFFSAVEVIEKTREEATTECLQNLEDRLGTVIENGGLRIPGMQPHIEEVQNFLNFSSQNYPPK